MGFKAFLTYLAMLDSRLRVCARGFKGLRLQDARVRLRALEAKGFSHFGCKGLGFKRV